jgi:hypothetical protein
MTIDTNPHETAPYVSDDELSAALVHASHLIAGRAAGADEQSFKTRWLDATASSAPATIAADLAAFGSLAMLRRMVRHEDPSVRFAAAHNSFAMDADVQVVLAGDVDEQVVLALIANFDPGLEACRVMVAGPHLRVKRILARRNLRDELLEILARDDNRSIARAARRQLDRRHTAPKTIIAAAA